MIKDDDNDGAAAKEEDDSSIIATDAATAAAAAAAIVEDETAAAVAAAAAADCNRDGGYGQHTMRFLSAIASHCATMLGARVGIIKQRFRRTLATAIQKGVHRHYELSERPRWLSRLPLCP
jgi:hypothetical protein